MLKVSEASATRPADTTAYTAGDVVGATVGNAMEFGLGSNAIGIVRSAVLIDSAAEATKPDLDLFLFDTEPTIAADNSAFALTDAQLERCIGVIQFAGTNFRAGATGNGVINATAFGEFAFHAPDKKLYGVLVARNAYVPIDSEKFTVRIGILTE